ncbi:MAG: right-handed parallel beta-helix repeat-containing protein [Myxococcales bacterium]|nr:right-handed parallel beta-helix repeat-containing protein [Myxococcales bacterium]
MFNIRHATLLLVLPLLACTACNETVKKPPKNQKRPVRNKTTPPRAEGWVPPSSPGANAGLKSADTAVAPCGGSVLCVGGGAKHKTIGAAVAAAADGATIQVAGGTYKENVVVKEKGVVLRGGFSDDFKSRDAAANVTRIEGVRGEAALAFLEAKTSAVDGFVITKGTGNELNKKYYILGGGIYARQTTITISHNVVEKNDIFTGHNNKESAGGGIYVDKCQATVKLNIVRDNKSGRGALAASGGKVRIEANVVTGNVAVGDHGGGIYVEGPAIEIVGNYIARNQVQWKEGAWGGGILVYNKGTVASMRGNIITANHATGAGSGTFIDDGARVTMANELIYANKCARDGGSGLYVDGADDGTGSTVLVMNSTIVNHPCKTGFKAAVYVEHKSEAVIKSSIIWGNDGDDFEVDKTSKIKVTHSIVKEQLKGKQKRYYGEGVLFVDPMFANAAGGDFHLKSTGGRWDGKAKSWVKDAQHSPAIDSGDPKAPVAEETAPNGDRINMGVYGGTAQASRSK